MNGGRNPVESSRPSVTEAEVKGPTAEAVHAELDRITASPGFVAAPQLSKFLRYVVEEKLAGRGGELNQYRVAVHALGQTAEFDPVVDAMVRTYANRLRRALDTYYATLGRNSPLRIAIPRGSYSPEFEPRPDPAATEEPIVRDEPSRFYNAETMRRSAISPTIALLPLRNLSPDDRHQYVADGLTEELMYALTRYTEFVAIGPLSRERLAREGMGPHEIGVRYGVRFLLDGGTSIHGGRIRVQVRLTDTVSGASVWADTYERQFDERAVPAILRSIGETVVGVTADAHGAASRLLSREIADTSPLDVTSQHALLMWNAYMRTLTPDSYEAARAALEEARDVEPASAQVMAALAGVYVDGYANHGAPAEVLEQGLDLVDAALRRDREDHIVRFVRAYVYFYTKEVDGFAAAVELALAANPRTSNNGDLAVFLALAGLHRRGMEVFEIVKESNPHHPGYYHLTTFLAHAEGGSLEAALAAADQINIPGYFLGPLLRAAALGYLGRSSEAEAAVGELLELQNGFADQGRDLLERLFHYQRPVDLVLQGLERAGLRI